MEKYVDALSATHKVLLAVSVALLIFAVQYRQPFQYSNALVAARQIVGAHGALQDEIAASTYQAYIGPVLAELESNRRIRNRVELQAVFGNLRILPETFDVDAVINVAVPVMGDEQSMVWRLQSVPIASAAEELDSMQLQVLNANLLEAPVDTWGNIMRSGAPGPEAPASGGADAQAASGVAPGRRVAVPCPESTDIYPVRPTASTIRASAPASSASASPPPRAAAETSSGGPVAATRASTGSPSLSKADALPPGCERSSTARPSVQLKAIPMRYRVPSYVIGMDAMLDIGRWILAMKLETRGRRLMIRPPGGNGMCTATLFDFGKRDTPRDTAFAFPCEMARTSEATFSYDGYLSASYFLTALNIGATGIGNWDEIQANLRKRAEIESGDDASNGIEAPVKMRSSTVTGFGAAIPLGVILYMTALTNLAHRLWRHGDRTKEKRDAALIWFDWFRGWMPVLTMVGTVIVLPTLTTWGLYDVTHPWLVSAAPDGLSIATFCASLAWVAYSAWFAHRRLLVDRVYRAIPAPPRPSPVAGGSEASPRDSLFGAISRWLQGRKG
jgi:hypothetical protein